jgi:hypothetical protein
VDPRPRAELARGLNTLRSPRERLDYAEAPIPPERIASETRPVRRGIFLVHGHNAAAKQAVARFLDHVTETGAVVLGEEADAGRTIIEKFDQYAAEAGYAVVLLTADDEGRKRGTKEELEPRARENVILELGCFVGTLGPERVALLYEEGVELPSDIAGVLYLPLDETEAWKRKLGRRDARRWCRYRCREGPTGVSRPRFARASAVVGRRAARSGPPDLRRCRTLTGAWR